ncbi:MULTISPECIES: hypothetical protein [unclassified Providencia]|uniref:hypothetical protein n=1 Tax=unclassified Providencia TaxID=2633465 RepID=UPI0014479A09|nr:MULTISPECIES: hypothetical protein [unclassified Providencia]
MDTITLAILLYIGGAGLMLNTLIDAKKSYPIVKCWLWIFICFPYVKAEIIRLRK